MKKEEILAQFNLKLPVVASPMFIVSQMDLVSESCKNGIIGTFPALNNRTSEGFEQWLIDLKADLKQFEEETGTKPCPYGVNLIIHKTNARVQADLDICVRQQVPIVITSLGAAEQVVKAIHSYGGLVFHDVTNKYHAQKAIAAGVDGLILVTAGAGGHAGINNPIPFVAEIREIFDGIILLGGAISTGQDVATAMQMGVDLAYMGTRFINTKEAVAKDEYKQMIIDSGTADIVYTAAVSGIPANYLRMSLEAIGVTKDMWDQKVKVDLGKKLDVEAKAWKNIWSAGQGVASIKDNPSTKDLIARLRSDFKSAIERQHTLLEKYK